MQKQKQEKLMKLECDPLCGFMIRSHENDEIVRFSKEHASDVHHTDYSNEAIRKMIKPA